MPATAGMAYYGEEADDDPLGDMEDDEYTDKSGVTYVDPIGQALVAMQRLGEPHPTKKYVDYTYLKPQNQHREAPLWVCPNGDIYLEAYSPFYKKAKEFLQQVAEPQ